ncbi:unnamed protein product [Caenorhabditis bovis]|uniref:Uncharacterized protein n=1 Tax=Caenorhabditis bovis TaxID=2654633 RepID=A0A8S1EME2_9PELO|nr:unnamed protein product [Caenorhabditis bovis]
MAVGLDETLSDCFEKFTNFRQTFTLQEEVYCEIHLILLHFAQMELAADGVDVAPIRRCRSANIRSTIAEMMPQFVFRDSQEHRINEMLVEFEATQRADCLVLKDIRRISLMIKIMKKYREVRETDDGYETDPGREIPRPSLLETFFKISINFY